MKGSTLVAYGSIDAASTTITAAAFIALPLFTPAGVAIAGNILPAHIGRIQFATSGNKNFILGIKNGAGAAAYEPVAVSQQDAMEIALSQQAVGIKSMDLDITTGKHLIYFYA